MCSITINQKADSTLNDQSQKDKRMIESRMIGFAQEASVERTGALDIAPMTRMPPDLKNIRKKTVGRHRVYYTGHHSKCTYNIFFIKEYKKSGVNDEDDSSFQKLLGKAMSQLSTRTLTTSD